jgi:hypothetical protein
MESTGHGRSVLPSLTDREAKVAIEAMGLVAELVLEKKMP